VISLSGDIMKRLTSMTYYLLWQ